MHCKRIFPERHRKIGTLVYCGFFKLTVDRILRELREIGYKRRETHQGDIEIIVSRFGTIRKRMQE